jgi:hypothetical protein
MTAGGVLTPSASVMAAVKCVAYVDVRLNRDSRYECPEALPAAYPERRCVVMSSETDQLTDYTAVHRRRWQH